MLILSIGISRAQTEGVVKLKLDTTVCNAKLSVKDIIDSTSIDKSIILTNQFGNTIAFFIVKKAGACVKVFTHNNLEAISNDDSIAFIQLNGKGLKELVIFNVSTFGNSGALGGSSSISKDLIIIDLDSESVLFDEAISAGEEMWSNGITQETEDSNAEDLADAEENINTNSIQSECDSHLSIMKGRLLFSKTCKVTSSEDKLSQEEKNDYCSRCVDGAYELKNNKFIKVK
jgi:hypothetical protein